LSFTSSFRLSYCRPISQNQTVENAIPQKYPSCVVFGKGQSMQCDGGSCAAGRGIRSCHSGIGRFCYHHGRRACPAHHSVSTRLLSNPIPQVLVLPAHSIIPCHLIPALVVAHRRMSVPFQGRSSRRRRYRRRYACWLLRMYPPTVLVVDSRIDVVDCSHVKIANSPVWAESAIRLF
jgi:hypothetical protein